MKSRAAQIEEFLTKAAWRNAERHALAGDASARRYARLTMPDGATAVLMDSPPDTSSSVAPFLRIGKHLTDLSLSAPAIYHADEHNGLLLIEDLGDDLFARVIPRDPAQEIPLYEAAAGTLIHLQKTPAPGDLEVMNPSGLAGLVEPLFAWYMGGAGLEWRAPMAMFQEQFNQVLTKNLAPPSVLILRDFHAENLLWLPHREGLERVGILDFQDALVGHRTYDLVSLLQDARRDVAPATEQSIKSYFAEVSGISSTALNLEYALLGAQRNLRIVGVFARLCLHFGKPHYVDMIPRVYELAKRNLAHPALRDTAEIFAEHVPEPTPSLLDRLKDKCATLPMQ